MRAHFELVNVKKWQRRLTEVDEIVLSLYARRLTTGEISAHFAHTYGASASNETISRITDKVIEGDADLGLATVGAGLCGDLHRRDDDQGP